MPSCRVHSLSMHSGGVPYQAQNSQDLWAKSLRDAESEGCSYPWEMAGVLVREPPERLTLRDHLLSCDLCGGLCTVQFRVNYREEQQ